MKGVILSRVSSYNNNNVRREQKFPQKIKMLSLSLPILVTYYIPALDRYQIE